jgi:hypothetical protein
MADMKAKRTMKIILRSVSRYLVAGTSSVIIIRDYRIIKGTNQVLSTYLPNLTNQLPNQLTPLCKVLEYHIVTYFSSQEIPGLLWNS